MPLAPEPMHKGRGGELGKGQGRSQDPGSPPALPIPEKGQVCSLGEPRPPHTCSGAWGASGAWAPVPLSGASLQTPTSPSHTAAPSDGLKVSEPIGPGSPPAYSPPVAPQPRGRGQVPQQDLLGLSSLPTPSLSSEHTGRARRLCWSSSQEVCLLSSLVQFQGCPLDYGHVCPLGPPHSCGFSSWAPTASVPPGVTHSPLQNVCPPTARGPLDGRLIWLTYLPPQWMQILL